MPHPAKQQALNMNGRKELHNSVAPAYQARRHSKKGGAGAGNWGRVGEEYDAEDYLDYNDPNYDPEEQVGAVMEASSWSEC